MATESESGLMPDDLRETMRQALLKDIRIGVLMVLAGDMDSYKNEFASAAYVASVLDSVGGADESYAGDHWIRYGLGERKFIICWSGYEGGVEFRVDV